MSRRGLYEKVAFDNLDRKPDGQGGTFDDWKEQFQCRADYVRLRGSETVLAARLEGTQPTVIRVRVSSNTDAVTPDWRCRDTRSGEVFNIRSIARADNRLYYDMMAESGVAI